MRLLALLLSIAIVICFAGCSTAEPAANIAATTLPIYDFTTHLCQGTDITVSRLITQSVSCLHDYTLNVDQMRAIEGAQIVIINGAGLESFMDDALDRAGYIIDASEGICAEESHHIHDHEDHHHEYDPHFWLSPQMAKLMVHNIYSGLITKYPQYADTFAVNLNALNTKLDALQSYGTDKLSNLSTRKLITFHDGFHYFAESFDFEIVKSIEEESGAEASAAELFEIIDLVEKNELPAIFIEKNGANAAASIISAETGVKIYALDMAMAGNSYFDSMYHNIDTIQEALQ